MVLVRSAPYEHGLGVRARWKRRRESAAFEGRGKATTQNALQMLRRSVQSRKFQDAVSIRLLALVPLSLPALALWLVILAAILGVVVMAMCAMLGLVSSLAIHCRLFLCLVVIAVVAVDFSFGFVNVLPRLLAPDLDRLAACTDHPAMDVEAQSNNALLRQLVVLELCDNLVLANPGEAHGAIAHADGHNLATRPNAVWQQCQGVEALAAAGGAVDDDALVLIVPHAALPQRQHAIACTHDDLFAHAGALFGQAGDHDGAEQLLLLVLTADHDAAAQVGDGEGAAARGDPLLAEAAGAGGGGGEGGERGDVVVVGMVGVLGLEGRGAAEVAHVVDVEGGRVGGEDEGLRGEGVDERGGVDAAATAAIAAAIAAAMRRRRHGHLRNHLARHGVGQLDHAIGAGRVEVRAVERVGQRPAAALVSPRPPRRLNEANAILARSLVRRQPVRLHVTRRQPDRHDRLVGMDGLGKHVVLERDRAHVLEHGCASVCNGGRMAAGVRIHNSYGTDSFNFCVEPELLPGRIVAGPSFSHPT
ncbi:hypothetical protein J1614_010662 [Plenodomus biglobosus]|nr:hypothetical protein J1614_010662 [Plenodomus biglobosus]